MPEKYLRRTIIFLTVPLGKKSDFGLALRGKKVSDFSILGMKNPFSDLGLALRGKILGFFDLGCESPFSDLVLALRGKKSRISRPWV